MAKTLVITGADFSANKLDTVILDKIPCTGISLAEAAANVSYGGTYTAIATVTPVNTTQPVVWSSNNENFSVDDGVVTINGVGQAVITATCGEYSASVTLTSTAVYDANDFAWADAMNMNYSGDVASLTSTNSRFTFGRISETDYHALWTDAATQAVGLTFCPVIIPPGSTYMKVDFTASYGTKFGFANRNQECSSGNGGVKIVSAESASVKAASRTITVPEGANGVYGSLWSNDKNLLTITFS